MWLENKRISSIMMRSLQIIVDGELESFIVCFFIKQNSPIGTQELHHCNIECGSILWAEKYHLEGFVFLLGVKTPISLDPVVACVSSGNQNVRLRK